MEAFITADLSGMSTSLSTQLTCEAHKFSIHLQAQQILNRGYLLNR